MIKFTNSVFIFFLVLLFGCDNSTTTFYVSKNGSDSNPGSKSKPFATLQYARDIVRQTEKRDTINIFIREGTYQLPETLMLEPSDSGAENAPIIWSAAENEKVIISGGKEIEGTWNTKDGKIWFTEIPEAKDGGWVFRQLFVDEKRVTRARFPNKTDPNPFLYAEGGTDTSIYIPKKLIKKSWREAADVQINIVPNWKFFNQWNTIRDVDFDNGIIYLENEELHAEITKGNWFYIEGVRQELDQSEEWFLDTEEGILYYIPADGQNPNEQTVVAPFLNRLIYVRGDAEKQTHVNHVYFRDLEFRHTTFSLGHIEARVHTDAAIMFENANHCYIENCHFENIGGYALWLHLDSQGNIFDNNIVQEAGAGGVLFTGARFSYMDDSKLYTPGNTASRVFPILNEVTNNVVRYSGKIRYYGGGVHLDSRPASMSMSPGNYIAHNHFYDLSRNGIFAFRNQGGNVIEYNHIHDVMQTTIDGACIHIATMNHLNAPNYILNNYLYDIWGYEQLPDGNPKRHLANGIFLDWATSNTTVKNNYIYNSGGQPIKMIMGNWNLSIEGNMVSEDSITPPFMDELGPGGNTSNDIILKENYLTGNVIHYTDDELVDYDENWQSREITGFWDLFNFNILEAPMDVSAEINYNLSIEESGLYQVSLLYLPDEKNASNANIEIHHSKGTSTMQWDMREGDRFGFAVEIGQFYFDKNGIAGLNINNLGADGTVVANSVAFVKVD